MKKSKFRLSCIAILATAAMSSLGSCSSDELLDGTNTLPGNAIAFNVTQQDVLSRGTETNSGNFQNQIKDFQVWICLDKATTGNGVTPGGLYVNDNHVVETKVNVTQQGALSRGTETNSGNFQNQIKDFQVWAYFDKAATGTGVTPGGLYVGDSHTVGTKVNGDTKGAWSYDDVTKQQYWPATTAPLNFQAITPYAHSSFTIENTPDVNDPKLAHVTANVTVPTAVADQQDIMFAKADGQTRETNSQTVGLNFQHGMSQVVFSGKLASDKIEATVHGIEIHNLHNTGKVGYMGSNAELQAQTTGVAGTTFAAGLVENAKVTSSSQTTVLSAADGALFMLPQTVAKWTTTAKNPVSTSEADANHNSYLKVTCTVKDKASGVVLVDNGAIYIPLDVNWQQGKKYNYTLVFTQGENDLPKQLIYQSGYNVKLTDRAELCKSIIADGKELIMTGNERGTLTVPELKDEKVYITFKEDVTDFSATFKDCSALKEIPEDLFANHPNVISFDSSFSGCSALVSISENLFANNPAATDFGSTFKGCTSLTYIPGNLFANCPEVTDFSETFYGCKALTAIPENLFANNPSVTAFFSTFKNCIALQSIPENLFANNLAVTTFEGTFYNCWALKSIPTGLFAHNPNITTFWGTFWDCSALTAIPENLFANNPAVTTFQTTFYGCNSLTSIPEKLFANNPEVSDFGGTFKNCIALQSIPGNLFANCPEVTDFSETFYDCSPLKEIPENLFANNRKVTSFAGTFSGCSSLHFIPVNLFANNPEVTDFAFTFYGCTSLTTIPENLFANNPKVTNFAYTFTFCSSLIDIPEGLFANNPSVTSFTGTFGNCIALTHIPGNLFDNNPEVTDFHSTFRDCSSFSFIPVNLFDNNTKVTDFRFIFKDCSALNGESPYTMIDGQKVHLYERKKYPEQFATPSESQEAFYECTKLTDYAQIPTNWKN